MLRPTRNTMNRYVMTSSLPGWLRAAVCVGALLGVAVIAPASAQEQTVAPASELPAPSPLDWSQLNTSDLPAFDKSIKAARPINPSDASVNWNRTANSNGAAVT